MRRGYLFCQPAPPQPGNRSENGQRREEHPLFRGSFDMSWVGKTYDAANMQQTFKIADVADLTDDAQREQWDEVKQGVTQDFGLCRHR